MPPLYAEWVEHDVAPETILVVANGARVADASENSVVRRLAGSCGHKGHIEMMEYKLERGE